WSPDGRRIVFVSILDPDIQAQPRPQQSDVWVTDLNGTGRINLTNGEFGNYQPVWASTGRVFFVSNRSGIDNIWAATASSWGGPASGPNSVVTADSPAADTDGQP
ncbi:MAG: TolB family protein, partial [Planctomycetota bacterium]